MIKIAFLDNAKLKALKWVQKATSKDGARPTLRATTFNGFVGAADGIRLQAINTTIPISNEDGTWEIEENVDGICEVPASLGTGLVAFRKVDVTYPDLESIVPKDEPFFTVDFNPKLLASVLTGMNDHVTLAFHRNKDGNAGLMPLEVFGKIGDIEAYALVMPLYSDGENKHAWKPTKKESNPMPKPIPEHYQQAVQDGLKALDELEKSGKMTADSVCDWMAKYGFAASYRWLAVGMSLRAQKKPS